MCYLMRFHHLMPHVFYDLPPGEKRIVRNMVVLEAEDRNREIESISGGL